MSTAIPRYCKSCGGDLNAPIGFGAIRSIVAADDGEHHYSCWSGPPKQLRDKLDQIAAVCDDNAKPECDAHMALKFIRSLCN